MSKIIIIANTNKELTMEESNFALALLTECERLLNQVTEQNSIIREKDPLMERIITVDENRINEIYALLNEAGFKIKLYQF